MNRWKTLALIAAVRLNPGLPLNGSEPAAPPIPYIDKGACPFEGCSYREWTTNKAVQLLDRPNGTHVIANLKAGEHVTGLTGEVHSIPVLLHAQDNKPDPEHPDKTLIRKGEPYYILHYLGEGTWLIWYHGKLTSIEILSSKDPLPKATWWVKIKTAKGITGWTVSNKNFDGQDSLA